MSTLTKKLRTKPQRLSLDKFLSLAQRHQAEIKAVQNSVLEAHELFSEGEGVWPDQCDCIIESIDTMRTSVKRFARLLDTPELLPIVVSPLRYSLIVDLHYIDELTSELMWHTTELRKICQPQSRQATTLQKEIMQHLEELAQESEDLLQQVDMLHDQIRFMTKSNESLQSKTIPVKFPAKNADLSAFHSPPSN